MSCGAYTKYYRTFTIKYSDAYISSISSNNKKKNWEEFTNVVVVVVAVLTISNSKWLDSTYCFRIPHQNILFIIFFLGCVQGTTHSIRHTEQNKYYEYNVWYTVLHDAGNESSKENHIFVFLFLGALKYKQCASTLFFFSVWCLCVCVCIYEILLLRHLLCYYCLPYTKHIYEILRIL